MSSNNIYSNFKPTFLIIKQHSLTGKLYLHKTVRKDPIKYLGSGTHWVNHIKKYGVEHVQTLWYCLFVDEKSLCETAELLSKLYDVVDSKQWLNQVNENGLGGGVNGQCKNMLTVKDKNGKCFKVFKNDPRYVSGELVPNITGFKHSVKTKTHMQNSRCNMQNSNAKVIKVYDTDDTLQFEFFGTWTKDCMSLDIPRGLLRRSLRNNGERIYPKHKNLKRFNGWYAIKT